MKPDPASETEKDFWDLGDDDLDLELDETSEEKSAAHSAENNDTSAPPPNSENSTEIETEAEKIESLEEKVSSQESPARGTPSPPEEKASLAGVEKISLGILAALLLGGAAFALSIFYQAAPEGTLVVFDTDFPIKGKHASISEIETYWREPIRKGENADLGIRLEAQLIPCANITLTGAGNASLALSFQDSEKNLIGDPITLEVVNGTFKRSGSTKITINCTAGFEDSSYINSYTNGDVDPWSLLIVEGAPGENLSYNETKKKLAVFRIKSTVREKE